MTERALPNRRETQRQRLRINKQKIYVDCGLYDDGTLGEVFIATEKTGSERRWMYDEIARLASKLLQYGCPIEEITSGWVGTKMNPSGPVEGHDQIKFCTSILDAVARHLLIEFCGQEELAHVKKEAIVRQQEEAL
jgi:ribonucleoside-diphosphate reductase alpha chain